MMASKSPTVLPLSPTPQYDGTPSTAQIPVDCQNPHMLQTGETPVAVTTSFHIPNRSSTQVTSTLTLTHPSISLATSTQVHVYHMTTGGQPYQPVIQPLPSPQRARITSHSQQVYLESTEAKDMEMFATHLRPNMLNSVILRQMSEKHW